jgi:hypothetical protein
MAKGNLSSPSEPRGRGITSHWTGARSAGSSSARLGCLVRCLRARSIPPLDASLMFAIKFTIVALAFIVAAPSFGQNSRRLTAFDPVPMDQRAHLAKRLKTFVEFQRTRQWGKLFDMSPKVHNQHPEETKEHFVKIMNIDDGTRLLAFVPQYSSKNFTIDADYFIDGCSKMRWDGKIGWYRTGLGAALENGEWYFTPIVIVAQMGAPPEPCNPRGGIQQLVGPERRERVL